MPTIDTLNLWGASWARFMGSMLIESCLLAAALAVVWLLVRRRLSPQFGYCLFVLVLIKLAIPVRFTVSQQAAPLLPQTNVDRITDWALPPEAFALQIEPTPLALDETSLRDAAPSAVQVSSLSSDESVAVEPPTVQPSLTRHARLMLGWVVGACLLMLRFFWTLWRTRRSVAGTTRLDTRSLPVDWDDLLSRAGVRRPVLVVTSDSLESPAVWGVLRPRVILPADILTGVTPSQLTWILLHELAHIRRSDLLVSVFQKLLQAVYFFNPAVHLANWAIDQLREYACDDEALAAVKASRRDCGEGFLTVVERVSGRPTLMSPPLGVFTRKTFIRRRLLRILDAKRQLRPRLSVAAVVLLLVAAAIVLPSLRAEEQVEQISSATVETLVSEATEISTTIEEQTPDPQTITLRLVDPNGNPVSGAKVGRYEVRWQDEAPRICGFGPKGAVISNGNGEASLLPEYLERDALQAFAVREDLRLGGIITVTKKDFGSRIELKLQPLCHVRGRADSAELRELGRPLLWSHGYLGYEGYSPRLFSHDGDKERQAFDYFVPPGKYGLTVYGSGSDGARTESVKIDFEIKPGQKELKLGTIDLPPTRFARLFGKPAPELQKIQGWRYGGPVTVADLRGKVVLLQFWSTGGGGYVPGLLADLHRDYKDHGLAVLAVAGVESIEAFDKKLAEIRERDWDGKDLPFPLALDGAGRFPDKYYKRGILGATAAAYGIRRSPTVLMIDRDGTLKEQTEVRGPRVRWKLDRLFGIRPKVADLELNEFRLRLSDTSGKPVAGAKVGSFIDRSGCLDGKKPKWYLPHGEGKNQQRTPPTTDREGKLVLKESDLHKADSKYKHQAIPLFAWHEERNLVGLAMASIADMRHEIPMTMYPACRVHGRIDSTYLREKYKGKRLGKWWTEVYVDDVANNANPTWYRHDWAREGHRYEFFLPPGKYQLRVEGGHVDLGHIRRQIEIKQGQRELELDFDIALDAPEKAAKQPKASRPAAKSKVPPTPRSKGTPDRSWMSKTLDVRVIDPDGMPVVGAQVGTRVRGSRTSSRKTRIRFELAWERGVSNSSGKDGLIRLFGRNLFERPRPSRAPESSVRLCGIHMDRRLAGGTTIALEDLGKQVDLKLVPACRLQGRVESKRMRELGVPLQHVYLEVYSWESNFSILHGGQGRPDDPNWQRFEYFVPPGKYRTYCYGSDDHGAYTDRLSDAFEIQPDQGEFEFNIELPPDKLTTLFGKPAPELDHVKEWRGKPVTLAKLKGKVVLLHFWRGAGDRGGLLGLVELHEAYHDAGLEVIVIHNDRYGSISELLQKEGGPISGLLDRDGRPRDMEVRQLPFRIALDGGGKTRIERIRDRVNEVDGATFAAYGINHPPGTVLIARDGRIITSMRLRSRDLKGTLERALGIRGSATSQPRQSSVPSWQARELVERMLDERKKIRSGHFVIRTEFARKKAAPKTRPSPGRSARRRFSVVWNDDIERRIFVDGDINRTDMVVLKREADGYVQSVVCLPDRGLVCLGRPGGAMTPSIRDRIFAVHRAVDPWQVGRSGGFPEGTSLRDRFLPNDGKFLITGNDLIDGHPVTIVEVARRDRPGHGLRLWIAPTRSYSVLRYDARSPKSGWKAIGRTKIKQHAGGMWYPSKIEWGTTRGGTWHVERTITVVKAEINTEIPPETFTFEGMGAKEGALIGDHRRDSPTQGRKPYGVVGPVKPKF